MSAQQTPTRTTFPAKQRQHSLAVRSSVHCTSPCSVALAVTGSSSNANWRGDSAAAASIRPFSLSRAAASPDGSEKLLGTGVGTSNQRAFDVSATPKKLALS